VLECVVNISEGRRRAWLAELVSGLTGVGDVHSDDQHHRSVLTLLGSSSELIETVVELAKVVTAEIDFEAHRGVHPRIGALDVVPFVPLGAATMDDAVAARDRCAERLTAEVDLPVYLYGPMRDGSSRTLPEVRRAVREGAVPDLLARHPGSTAGAAAVGARGVLVAWNLWLSSTSLARANELARALRSSDVRTLAFAVGGAVQVSCNLIDPLVTTPAEVYDDVERRLQGSEAILRSELVGLVPRAVLSKVGEDRFESLDLSEEQTIEAAITRLGLDTT